jgi:modified peptide precursor CbpA
MSVGTLFYYLHERKETTVKEKKEVKKETKKEDVIAYRKACKAEGTGLSHYILMDKKKK